MQVEPESPALTTTPGPFECAFLLSFSGLSLAGSDIESVAPRSKGFLGWCRAGPGIDAVSSHLLSCFAGCCQTLPADHAWFHTFFGDPLGKLFPLGGERRQLELSYFAQENERRPWRVISSAGEVSKLGGTALSLGIAHRLQNPCLYFICCHCHRSNVCNLESEMKPSEEDCWTVLWRHLDPCSPSQPLSVHL